MNLKVEGRKNSISLKYIARMKMSELRFKKKGVKVPYCPMYFKFEVKNPITYF